ncbi:hypothetical protein IAQ61_003779 [Plenodomus lingam]|uniref:Predicted protein n=1 Tax=Leptosphaeria maculans (strain JN3 / isolate v23.1.3 / race Av1-4-5-6-7-8) TaxID=985895 RepID=E4ZRQ7_LEPMJ|nr:predicted protein [Plenodomus lingam JN3]KAH9874590.1 hypothetical protein IAQ61_003779 [Plenodomus lingam]CBX93904.1 predicted protein [Plenodomus lingam JN3]
MTNGAATKSQNFHLVIDRYSDPVEPNIHWTNAPWEPVDTNRVGFSKHSLFLGHIKRRGIWYKVSARLNDASHIKICLPEGVLPNAEIPNIEFAGFWRLLVRVDEPRPKLPELKTLCHYYFLAAGHVEVRDRGDAWHVAFNKACEMLWDGAGSHVRDEEMLSRNLQRLLVDAASNYPSWALSVEGEVAAAWPGYKKGWKF